MSSASPSLPVSSSLKKGSSKTTAQPGTVRVLCSNCEKILVPSAAIQIDESAIVVNSGAEKSETETDAEKKKRNQRREDIHVYVTMATIVLIAAIVTILKVALQNVIFTNDAVDDDGQKIFKNTTE